MKLYILIKRILKYATTSGIAFSLDLFLLYLFVEFLGFYYLLAAGIAFTMAHSTNYIMQRKWGFKETKTNLLKAYTYFFCFGILGIFMTLFLLALLVENFGINYILGRIIIAFSIGLFNFIFNYTITFKMTHELFSRK